MTTSRIALSTSCDYFEKPLGTATGLVCFSTAIASYVEGLRPEGVLNEAYNPGFENLPSPCILLGSPSSRGLELILIPPGSCTVQMLSPCIRV